MLSTATNLPQLPFDKEGRLRIRIGLQSILLFLIVAVSLLVEFFYQPYTPVGPQLIQNPGFSRNHAGWHSSGEVSRVGEGHVRLKNEGGDYIELWQEIKLAPKVKGLVLTASASSKSIVQGEKPWNSGRVVLVSYHAGSDKADYHRPHYLLRLVGTEDWQLFQKLFHVYPGVDRLKLHVQLPRASGVLEVKDLQLHEAVFKRSWLIINAAMITASLIFLVWVFLPYLKGRPGRLEYAGLGSIALIVVFTTVPSVLKNDIYGWLKNGLSQINDAVVSDPIARASIVTTEGNDHFFSIMHYLLFGVTAFLLLLATRQRSIQNKVYDLSTLAVITECIQVFVRGRGASVLDVGVDMFGLFTGLGVWYLWRVYLNVSLKKTNT